jgi:hypothetical protein
MQCIFKYGEAKARKSHGIIKGWDPYKDMLLIL